MTDTTKTSTRARAIRCAITLAGTVMPCIAVPADAAVIFGTFGNGVVINSTSTAQVKSPLKPQINNNSNSFPVSATSLPLAPLFTSSSAVATDSDAAGGVFSAQSNNLTTVTFASAGSAILTFAGAATASESNPGLAQASSNYLFEYSFTLTDRNPFALDLAFSASNLGCCGNQVSLQSLDTGQYVFFNNNYASANTFNYAGNLQSGAYRLTISKGEYFGYDAPSFNGSGTGTRSNTHNDRVAFTIGNPGVGAVPEPATWTMLIVGFGMVGGAVRRRRVRPISITA